MNTEKFEIIVEHFNGGKSIMSFSLENFASWLNTFVNDRYYKQIIIKRVNPDDSNVDG